MNEADYLMKNYGDRGGRIMEIEDKLIGVIRGNIRRDLHNSSYDTKAEFNNCSIIHSK